MPITPQQSYPHLARAIGVSELWLKREDLHPFGSHKGRSIPVMIEQYIAKGVRHFVISSSGNAAIAAAKFIETYNKNHSNSPLSLIIFIGKKIDQEKRTLLFESSSVTIECVERPKQAAFQEAKKTGATLLRQSTDDLALLGYHELALELAEIPNLSAVFIPTSSGTTAQGIGEAFEKLGKKIKIHIIQTASCHPMVKKSEIRNPKSEIEKKSLATAIVDHIAHRKQAVATVVRRSGGSGWIATNKEIGETMNITKKETHIEISPNSALSIAGVIQAVRSSFPLDGAIACFITGP